MDSSEKSSHRCILDCWYTTTIHPISMCFRSHSSTLLNCLFRCLTSCRSLFSWSALGSLFHGRLVSYTLLNWSVWLTSSHRLLAVVLLLVVVHYRFVGHHVHDGAWYRVCLVAPAYSSHGYHTLWRTRLSLISQWEGSHQSSCSEVRSFWSIGSKVTVKWSQESVDGQWDGRGDEEESRLRALMLCIYLSTVFPAPVDVATFTSHYPKYMYMVIWCDDFSSLPST
jgi:hypothetical protein